MLRLLGIGLGVMALATSALAQSPAAPSPAAPLDGPAKEFVSLVLEFGVYEPLEVDAYYGPKALADAAKAHPRSLAELSTDAAALEARVKTIDASGVDVARRRYLLAQLKALTVRIAMKQGRHFDFADEAEGLYGARPVLRPLQSYDALLAEIDHLVPGQGPLNERLIAYRKLMNAPRAKAPAVIAAATTECRDRVLKQTALPHGEAFDFTYVSGKPWSANNAYQGGYHSKIEINTDFESTVAHAITLGCHEGYPGHHVQLLLQEEQLVRQRGWVEYTILPLFSPTTLIAEGAANYGVSLAFPGDDVVTFEEKALCPLAGVDCKTARAQARLDKLTRRLVSAEYVIAADYLDGRINHDQALAEEEHYQLIDATRAEQRLSFFNTYRSYIINYGLGQDLIEAYGARIPAGPARWRWFFSMITGPTIAADLQGSTPPYTNGP
jgi:hypothetical protein